MKKLFVLIAATVICSQSFATSFILEGSLTLFTNYSKVEGQKAVYSSKATYSLTDGYDYEALPTAEALFPMDTAACFSGYAWSVEWIIGDIVSKDESYKLNMIETSEDGESLFFAIENTQKQVKSFTIHRCL